MEVPHGEYQISKAMTPHSFLITILLLATSCQSETVTKMPVELSLNLVDSVNAFDFDVNHVGDMMRTETSWFFLDRASGVLVKADSQFRQVQKYTAKGRGPHELAKPQSFSLSNRFLFLLDAQHKIVQFDFELNPIDELLINEPSFSILALNDSILWLGALNMAYEDVHQINTITDEIERIGKSRKVNLPLESVVFHASNHTGHIARYRVFGNGVDLYHNSNLRKSFKNVSQPDFPLVNHESPVPIYKTKTHNIAFLTESLACFLSGDIGPRRQPIQCFDFDGNLVSRYVIPTPSPFATYHDSLLYTYSPETNHIYVYDLGF